MKLRVKWLGRVSYADGLAEQERHVAAKGKHASDDVLLMLEHEPVYTIGRTRDQSSLRDTAQLPHPVVEINRGGQATYHGPGQLVGYPILNLHNRGNDLHRYLRDLEEVLILALDRHDIPATRRDGLTGVWVGERKIASIGVGVRHWVSMHGFALNVCGDLSPFQAITPCGLTGVEMTSLERETGKPVTVQAIADEVSEVFRNRFGYSPA